MSTDGLQAPQYWDESPRQGLRHHVREFNMQPGVVRLAALRDALYALEAAGTPLSASIHIAGGFQVVAQWEEQL